VPVDDYIAAYDALLARWPVPVTALDVPGEFGTTRVNVSGPEDAPPLVLVHGGRTASPGWFANAAELSREHRVYAIDTMGDPGRSVNDGRRVRSRADLARWLDELIAALGLENADYCGHSFGAWQALTYALRTPRRVRRLVLLDPTQCFAGFSVSCLWHAALGFLPGGSMESYLSWESRGAGLDPGWLAFQLLGSAAPTGKLIAARRPSAEQLSSLTVPVLVLLAERSRVHDLAKVREAARRTLPHAVIETLPGVSHHMIPFEHPKELNRRLLEFLD
jgi:pimeloyl-ACP methyl ester carboxylesterase